MKNFTKALLISCSLSLLPAITLAAVPADIPQLLDVVKAGPAAGDKSPFLQAGRILQEKMKDASARTPSLKKQLLELAANQNGAIQNAAYDALMEFKGDPDVRKLFTGALHSHPNAMTRGVMTGRLMVNTDRDPSVFPELKKALEDESEFVRVRAAQDLGRQGDYSGLDVMKKVLSETPVADLHPKIGTLDSDGRVSTAARAAGEVLHPDLLPLLKRLAGMEKTAPRSAGEARSSMWLLELKLAKPEEKMRKLRSIAQLENGNGMFWIERTLVYKLDALKISKEDVISVLKEFVANPDFNTSHGAKAAIRRYEFIGAKR